MVKKPIFRTSPEKRIEDAIRVFLAERGWLVEKMVGNAYQSGIPDLMCWHPTHGLRWVDVKVRGRYKYTKAQIQKWPKWEGFGLGVWIMFEATEVEYDKLFEEPNFMEFWKPAYDKYLFTVDEILDEEEM